MKNAIPPGVIKDDAAFVSLVIDKQDLPGCDYLEFVIGLGATDVAMAVLKVMESATKTNDTTLGELAHAGQGHDDEARRRRR